MDAEQPRATRKNLLSDEQREFLRSHRVRCRTVIAAIGVFKARSWHHDYCVLSTSQQLWLPLQVMSNPQLHQLAAQIKVLNRIRDQSKSLHKQQSMQIRPTTWSINLTQDLIHGQAKVQPHTASRQKKKASKSPKISPSAKRHK